MTLTLLQWPWPHSSIDSWEPTSLSSSWSILYSSIVATWPALINKTLILPWWIWPLHSDLDLILTCWTDNGENTSLFHLKYKCTSLSTMVVIWLGLLHMTLTLPLWPQPSLNDLDPILTCWTDSGDPASLSSSWNTSLSTDGCRSTWSDPHDLDPPHDDLDLSAPLRSVSHDDVSGVWMHRERRDRELHGVEKLVEGLGDDTDWSNTSLRDLLLL